MQICYIDESGDSGVFNPRDPRANPFFILCGLTLDHSRIHSLTRLFINLKSRFYPQLLANSDGHSLDSILKEVKGNELRAAFREGNRRKIRAATGFMDGCLDLLKACESGMIAYCAVKAPYRKNSDGALYGQGIQYISACFNRHLQHKRESGLLLLDSRNPDLDRKTSHTIFTQQFRSGGNPYPRIAESPFFANSQNFAMLQLADIICSAMLFPLLSLVHAGYLKGIGSKHYSKRYHQIKGRYYKQLKELQVRWQEDERWHYSIFLRDYTHRGYKSSQIFTPCNWQAYAPRMLALPFG